jgi:hypothetical protein
MPACHHPTRPWPAEGRRSRHQKAACLQRLAWPRPTDRPTAARRPVGTAGSPGRPTVPPGVHERRVRGRVTANPNGMDAAGGDGAAVRAGGREEQKGATGRHGTLPHWDGDDGKSAATTGYGAPNGTVSPANPDPPQSPQAGLLAPYVAMMLLQGPLGVWSFPLRTHSTAQAGLGLPMLATWSIVPRTWCPRRDSPLAVHPANGH